MALTSVRPNATLIGIPAGWSVVGAATPHQALSDDSNSSYLDHSGAAGPLLIGSAAASIPAGAIVRTFYLRLVTATKTAGKSGSVRTVLQSGNTPLDTTQVITWSTPASTNVATLPAADPASAVSVFYLYPMNGARVYEATTFIRYVPKPIVTSSQITTSLSADSRPELAWITSLDPDGGEQARYRVQLYQDGDDTNGTPRWETEGAGMLQRLRLPDSANGNYRVFVQVAQNVGGADHWSDRKELLFTLAVPRPGIPTISVAGEDGLGYVSIELTETAGSGNTDYWEVEWSPDGSGDWNPIFSDRARAGKVPNPTPGSGLEIAADYEAGNRETRFYRARAVKDNGGGNLAASAWSTVGSGFWKSGRFWIKDVRYPGRNLPVEIASLPGYSRGSRDGIFQGLGSRTVVLVSDVPGPPSGEIELAIHDDVDRRKLDGILEAADPVLIQATPGSHWQDRWVRLTGLQRTPAVDKVQVSTTLDRFTWVEVPNPI